MFSKTKFACVVAAAWGVLVLCAGPEARAMDSRVIVRTGDLDLSQPSAPRFLLRRIESAAARVCDATMASYHPGARRIYEACKAETVARVVNRINSPALRRAYLARYDAN